MNSKRITLTLIAAVSLGLGACGGSNDTADQAKQIQKDGAAIQKKSEQIQRDAKAGKDTTKAQADLLKQTDGAVGKTKALADKALDDVKSKTLDPEQKKAIDDVKKSLVEVPLPSTATTP